MPETKKQHFIPFAYLKYFRCHENDSSRELATIYRDDGTSVTEEKVANQCYANNFYRKKNTIQSEEGFGVYEKDWDECIANARAGVDESALLILQMVMYHFRNISIRVLKDDMDRYELVTTATRNFIEQKILQLPKGEQFSDHPEHVTNFPWAVRLINFAKPILLTSDNPSVMTIRTKEHELYGPFFLPVSPTELLVAIDKSTYRFVGSSGVDQDAYNANAAVAAQSSRHVFVSSPLQESVRASLWEFLEEHRIKDQEKGAFEQNRFKPCHPVYENEFTFVERRPSLALQSAIKKAIRAR